MFIPTTSVASRIPLPLAEKLAALAESQKTTVSKVVRSVLTENVPLDKATAE